MPPTFNPPDTAADPATIEAAAERFYKVAGTIVGRTGDLEAAFNTAATKFSDLVSPQIRQQGGYNVRDWREAANSAVYGAAVTKGWAADVQWFKDERAKLIAQWNAAAADDFGVRWKAPFETVPNEVFDTPEQRERNHQARIDAAGEQKLSELNALAAGLWAQFQERAGKRGGQLSGGPTPANQRSLIRQGLLGWAPYNIMGANAPLPINPKVAEKYAEQLKRYLKGDQKPDTDFAEIISALNAVLQQAKAQSKNGGKVNPELLTFLQQFYGGLDSVGKGQFPKTTSVLDFADFANNPHLNSIFDNKQLVRDVLGTMGTGLLVLSNEKLGGGVARLPKSVRDVLSGAPGKDGWWTREEHRQQAWGFARKYADLTELLDDAAPKAVGGKEFSERLVGVLPDYFRGMDLAADTSFGNDYYEQGPTAPRDEQAQTALDIANRNTEAKHGLLTGTATVPENTQMKAPELLKELYSHEWSDKGKSLAGLTDWIPDHAGSDDPVQRKMADEATAGLVNAVTDLGSDPKTGTFSALAGGKGGKTLFELGHNSPEVAQSFARVSNAYLDEFGAPPRGQDTAADGKGLHLNTDDRARFWQLTVGDEKAAGLLADGITRHERDSVLDWVKSGKMDTTENQVAQENARLRGLFDSAVRNERTGLEFHDTERVAGETTGNIDTRRNVHIVPGIAKEIINNLLKHPAPKIAVGVINEVTRYGNDYYWAHNSPVGETYLLKHGITTGPDDLKFGATLQMTDAAIEAGKIPAKEIPDSYLKTRELVEEYQALTAKGDTKGALAKADEIADLAPKLRDDLDNVLDERLTYKEVSSRKVRDDYLTAYADMWAETTGRHTAADKTKYAGEVLSSKELPKVPEPPERQSADH